MRAALATIIVSLLLTGCYYDLQRIIEAATGAGPSGDAQLVNATAVAHLRRADPKAQIGNPDCTSSPTTDPYPSERFFNVCTLPVDGRAIPVGMRYDDDRKRVIAALLADIVKVDETERALAKQVQYRYGFSSTVHCIGPRIQVLPPGSAIVCEVRTHTGRTYPLKLRVVAKLWPHVVAYPIRALPSHANVAVLDREVNAAFRRSPRDVPGSLVADLLNSEEVPGMRFLLPNSKPKKAWCPAHLDVSETTLATAGSFYSTCEVESAFGVMRIAIFTFDGKTVAFQSLSQPFDLHIFERVTTAQEERILRAQGSSDRAKIDCGPERYIALYLSSVHYCQISFSSGKQARVGIEYYDVFEGPRVVWEANPSTALSRS